MSKNIRNTVNRLRRTTTTALQRRRRQYPSPLPFFYTRLKKWILEKYKLKPKTVQQLLELKGASSGNEVTLYFNGSDAFKEMWKCIDEAEHYVWMETYQLNPDHVGKTTLQKLASAAERGCDVILIYDYLGSYEMKEIHFTHLKQKGALVIVFHRLLFNFRPPWYWQWPLFRTHRKILVVDEKVGFCGGLNICDDYAGPEVGGNGRFRDTHCRLQGPCVTDLKGVFLNSIGSTDKRQYNAFLNRRPPPPSQSNPLSSPLGGKFVQILESDVRRNRRHIQRALCIVLRDAQRTCLVTSPYFVPPVRLRNAILRAKSRGVEIKVITQGLCRTPLVSAASQHIYGLFLKRGIPIYRLKDTELHAKTITVDGQYCSVGTFNLDELSFKHLLEVNATFLCPQLALQMEEQFAKDLRECEEITSEKWEKREWWKKVWHWTVYQIFRIFF